ncbi:MAG TPA: ORF6N domain-containing protein [Candidatus Gastranaerophilaceae bacterium]|nr:ORF6N domain-containing protein [Candidatus Gastranaerophilaceae bacterium]HPT41829.1 ORF6N domain-containing protein [Candidatus Gastranaerophilaceae bacterium]
MTNNLIPVKVIENKIFVIRGIKVMLDSDLAELYQVETKILNRAVKRNIKRFPDDFMFQLTNEEWEAVKVRCQFGTSPKGGGRQYLPYAFTEQGIAMLSGLLNSDAAIFANIQIMRVFVKIKQYALENEEIFERLSAVEQYLMQYSKDNNIEIDKINKAINLLLDRTKPSQIGFNTKE